MVETVQELNVPSIVLRNEQDYVKTLMHLRSYVDTVALLKNISVFVTTLSKKFDGEDVMIVNKKHLYFGMYNGTTKTVDRESKGVLLYPLTELIQEMQKYPEQFTADMHYYIKHFSPQLHSFTDEALAVMQQNSQP